jgi:hypothetical protein
MGNIEIFKADGYPTHSEMIVQEWLPNDGISFDIYQCDSQGAFDSQRILLEKSHVKEVEHLTRMLHAWCLKVRRENLEEFEKLLDSQNS